MCISFAIAAMNTVGATSISLLIMIFAFESCWSATIFTMLLRGLERHTKQGGSFLVSIISSDVVLRVMIGAVLNNRNAHIAMVIPMTRYILAFNFPIYVNIFQRQNMDSHREANVGIVPVPNEMELELAREGSTDQVERATEVADK